MATDLSSWCVLTMDSIFQKERDRERSAASCFVGRRLAASPVELPPPGCGWAKKSALARTRVGAHPTALTGGPRLPCASY